MDGFERGQSVSMSETGKDVTVMKGHAAVGRRGAVEIS